MIWVEPRPDLRIDVDAMLDGAATDLAAYRLVTYFHYFFFFNDTATTEIYTLSLHDALPISLRHPARRATPGARIRHQPHAGARSEEHTSELQSLAYLVCRLLLEKKKNK